MALLDELGVASQECAMSFSVRNDAKDLEYNGTTVNSLFAQRRNILRPSFLAMVRDILRFNRQAPRLLLPGEGELPLGLPGAAGLQQILRRPLHHSHGRGDLVHRSALDVQLPGAVLRPLPDESRHADGQ